MLCGAWLSTGAGDGRRISTRSKTGSLVPKYMDDYVTATRGSIIKAAAAARLQDAAATGAEAALSKEDKSAAATRVPGLRMTRSRVQAELMGVNQSAVFRLGWCALAELVLGGVCCDAAFVRSYSVSCTCVCCHNTCYAMLVISHNCILKCIILLK